MSQHTPGPWAVYGHPGSALGPEVRAGDRQGVPEDERVCRVDMAVGAYDLALANARLIAAAPDLLAALEAVMFEMASDSYCEWCQRHAPKNDEGRVIGPIKHNSTCLGEMARAAIAKATKR